LKIEAPTRKMARRAENVPLRVDASGEDALIALIVPVEVRLSDTRGEVSSGRAGLGGFRRRTGVVPLRLDGVGEFVPPRPTTEEALRGVDGPARLLVSLRADMTSSAVSMSSQWSEAMMECSWSPLALPRPGVGGGRKV
jgi:hypothetical protein